MTASLITSDNIFYILKKKYLQENPCESIDDLTEEEIEKFIFESEIFKNLFENELLPLESDCVDGIPNENCIKIIEYIKKSLKKVNKKKLLKVIFELILKIIFTESEN